jgi:predicted ATPase
MDTQVSHRDVGIGISQVLPVLVSAYASKEEIIAIEQPEIHLHPALQAELGDLFIYSALGGNGNTLLLETHSEHIILRILRRIRETAEGELPEGLTPVTPNQVSVLYVEPGKEGSEVIHIPVNEDGEFERPWPRGFFAERARELF